MNRGKDICKELKAVRRQIAEENGIALEIPECTYNGPCKGTCPRCESEVRFLETELAKRIKLGKVAKVAGLALTLGAAGTVSAQVNSDNKGVMLDAVNVETEKVPTIEGYEMPGAIVVTERHEGYVWLTGVVKDKKTGEPLPFVHIMINQDDKLVIGGVTNIDGEFSIEAAPGKYEMVISSVGYNKYEQKITIPKKKNRVDMDVIQLEPGTTIMGEVYYFDPDKAPLMEYDSSGPTQNMEIEGVKLKIQY